MSDTHSKSTGETGGGYCKKFGQDVHALGNVTLVNSAFGVNPGRVAWTEDIQQPGQTYAWKLFGATEGLIHPWKGIPASSSPNTRLLDSRPTRIPSSPTAPPFPTPHSTFRPPRVTRRPEGAVVLAGPPATTEPLWEVDVKGR